jgi:hypothetical protein
MPPIKTRTYGLTPGRPGPFHCVDIIKKLLSTSDDGDMHALVAYEEKEEPNEFRVVAKN